METRKNKYNYSDEEYDEEDNSEEDNNTSLNTTLKKNKKKVKNSEEFNFSQKRKRSNSESDIYFIKIKERSRYDKYFKKQNKKKQIEILDKEDEIYNYYNTDIPIRYKILYSSLSLSTKSLIIQKIDMYESMHSSHNESSKITKWLILLSKKI
jgi:hypothetical protein